MPTLMLWWSNITLGQKRFCLHKTGRPHSDFCLASIPHLKLDPPQLCHVNKHFPWLCMWSTVKCPTSQGVTPTLCTVNNCIWVHGNSKSILHILQVLNQKNRMQITGFRQGSNPSCLTICSRGKNIYVAFPISVNMGYPGPAHLSCVKSMSNMSAYSEGKCGTGASICKQYRDRSSTWGWKGKAAAHTLQCRSHYWRWPLILHC